MTAGTYSFSLKNSLGEEVVFGIDNKTKELFVDRSKSGKTGLETITPRLLPKRL
jgi:levanase/fructan beta-fructosidase